MAAGLQRQSPLKTATCDARYVHVTIRAYSVYSQARYAMVHLVQNLQMKYSIAGFHAVHTTLEQQTAPSMSRSVHCI